MNSTPKLLPALVATLCLLVIGYGLYLVVKETVLVAPWAATADQGRQHSHMKNTTRFFGEPDEVRRQVWKAVYLEENPPQVPEDWREEVRMALDRSPDARHALVLPGGVDDLPWALPGIYWAAYSGAPTFLTTENGLAEADAEALVALKLPVAVLAPTELVSEAILDGLRAKGVTVRRVAGSSIDDHAVLMATIRDEDADFGWGRTYDRRNGYFEYVLASPQESRALLAALPLAKSNAATILYTGMDGGVPGTTDRYLWKQRADWFVTPAEGPFRHLWIVGDRTTYASQARLDFALEKGDYPAHGPVALGPLEALAIVFIALGIASGLFVFVHGLRCLPGVPTGIRIAWSMTALLVPIVGALLYLSAYRRPWNGDDGRLRFERPGSLRAASATALGFGYGAPIMIAIGWLFFWFGLPLYFGDWVEYFEGWAFAAGAGMPIMMFVMWLGAILLAWLLVQYPLHRAMMPEMGRRMVLGRTFRMVFLSMSAVSLGMMTVSWIVQMQRLPMMPGEDDILWFGAMWLASAAGFLIAWPLNYPMVIRHLKMGDA